MAPLVDLISPLRYHQFGRRVTHFQIAVFERHSPARDLSCLCVTSSVSTAGIRGSADAPLVLCAAAVSAGGPPSPEETPHPGAMCQSHLDKPRKTPLPGREPLGLLTDALPASRVVAAHGKGLAVSWRPLPSRPVASGWPCGTDRPAAAKAAAQGGWMRRALLARRGSGLAARRPTEAQQVTAGGVRAWKRACSWGRRSPRQTF